MSRILLSAWSPSVSARSISQPRKECVLAFAMAEEWHPVDRTEHDPVDVVMEKRGDPEARA